ncbi:DNA repair protein RecN [Enterococcus sp. JM4C]|uniref:DNA repair protein RecN n=1 Tax=Candidatus Enterococcus huntleyi TaxID=1857217 RepID=UPI0013799654|nr:DNA repair protein RecN [Enterococcus sp. JM4C]KAF1297144.1 DNA repair protein RecN [Enterococcus sp. JM4C]
MLQELTIENFAIISKLRLSFHQGMTALTGETGAGKSIIIDAMGLLAGGRGSADYIRQGAQKCTLEGLFQLPKQAEFLHFMEELGIDTEEQNLIIQRDMSTSGKNICRVNGRIVTLATLRKIGEFLVDIHGQNEHQELMQADKHLGLLDEFGNQSFKRAKKAYHKAYDSFRQLEQQVKKIQANEKMFVQRIDMLKFQQEEIENAELQIDEEEQLVEEREKLSNHQKIVDGLAESYEALNAEGLNSLDGVGAAVSHLQGIAHLDTEFNSIFENVQNAYYLLQDSVGDISRQLDNLEFDENRLEEVNHRLEVIRQLKRKYGESVEAIMAYYEEISQELAESNFSDGQMDKLIKKLADQEEHVRGLAQELHNQRIEIAKKLQKSILTELKELYMANTDFEVSFLEMGNALQREGFDQVEFYITTNPGEPLKPLVKVASGGELSRVMLALKTIFSKNQGITSIVFDEVDTGVSGRVAQAIADKIYQVAQNSQVLCITHLPQVAAVANYQYYISKDVKKGRTETEVQQLTSEERVAEIARMLAGSEITDLTKKHAEELLAMAKK